MSTSLEMPTPGIVVVDNNNCGVIEHSNIIHNTSPQHQIVQSQHQSSHQQQQQQQQPQHIQTQQVIVNEEFISAENLVAGGVNYITTNELINNAQIIKFVSEEEAVLIEQQQQQQQQQHQQMKQQHHQHEVEQQQIYGMSSTQQTLQTLSNSNSKVHVISNVTIVSKSQHQASHAFSFVNSKHLGAGATSSSGNFVNTYISKQPTITQSGKIVNIPFKTNVNGQQIITARQHLMSQQQQQQQQTGSVMQKVPVHRNVQVVTRMQTLPQIGGHSNSNSGTTTINSRLGTALVTSGGIIQGQSVQQQQHHQMQLQKSQGGGGGQTIMSPSNNSGPIVKSTPTGRVKTIGGGSMKVMNNVTARSGAGSVKTTMTQQTPQTKGAKNAKLIKNANSTTQFTATYNAQAQSKNMHVHQTNIINNNNSSINNNNNNSNSNSKLLQQQQQQRPINNIYLQGAVQKVGKNSKFVIQQQQQQLSLQQQQQNQSNHLMIQTQQQQQQQSVKLSNSNHQQQQQQYQVQSNIGGASGTIKYVNAQGNVIAPPNRVRTILQQQSTSLPSSSHHLQQQQQQTHQTIYVENLMSPNNVEQSTPSPSNSTTTSSIDDIVMVNGTHMSEEMSARILQSLSQKSVYNNNVARQFNNQQQTHFKAQSSQPQQQQVYLTTSAASPCTNEQGQQQQYMVQQHSSALQSYHHSQQSLHYVNRTSSIEQIEQQNNTFGPEYFRVNTCDIQSSSTTFIDNIPLTSTRGDTSSYQQQTDQDDDIIGEEIRPAPVTTMDARLQTLHSVQHDHSSYAQQPKRVDIETTPVVQQQPQQSQQQVQQQQLAPTQSVATNVNTGSAGNNVAIGVPVPITTISNSVASANNTMSVSKTQNALLTKTPTGYTYMYNPSTVEKDDDASSVISTGSRAGNNLGPDLGEETDTAAEGEPDDDSVTRCICEFTHDDGYMICCDKCSVWQHVDCMGIDRSNIPEEYKCEACQPRQVEKGRARALQVVKRKQLQQTALQLDNQQLQHQQNQLVLNQQQSQIHQQLHQTNMTMDGGDSNLMLAASGGNIGDRNLLPFSQVANNNNTNKKQRVPGGKRKNNADAQSGVKRKRRESIAQRANGKPREPKKISKRKSAKQAQADAANEKQNVNLRAWIENYEQAITNHYSPELRARLQSIGKQQQQNNHTLSNSPILNNLISPIDGQCATVPHAGGKILISAFDILPNHVVIELRGKYMLGNQYRQQQIVTTTGKNVINRNPGPFIFFYRLPNDGPEICVDTRTYGNEARFVRRSCRPNSEILHTIEKGAIHLYIVSTSTVKSSTEITIKHEPHDLVDVVQGTIVLPTSTICACGLTKDCIFPGTPANVTNQPPAIAPTTSTKRPRANGQHLLSDGTVAPKKAYRRTKNTAQSAGRKHSTSSSGESNACLLSPNNLNASSVIALPPSLASNIIHDSGICTSASSPTVSLPSPSQCLQTVHVATPQESPVPEFLPPPPTVQNVLSTQLLLDAIKAMPCQVTETPITQAVPIEPSAAATIQQPVHVPILQTNPMDEPKMVVTHTSPIIAQSQMGSPPPPPLPPPPPPPPLILPQQQSPLSGPPALHSPLPLKTNVILESPPIIPIPTLSPMPSSSIINTSPVFMKSPPQTSRKTTPRKQSCSFSEDNTSMDDSFPNTSSVSSSLNSTLSKKEKESKESSEKKSESNKKLSREERKMQAIVRAFEKMEKNQQRKQELKQQKTPTSSNSIGSHSQTSNSKRMCGNSPQDKSGDDGTPVKKTVGGHARKKKRRNNRSHHQMNQQQRKRLRARMNSGDSDVMTSEESSSMLSPPLPSSVSHHSSVSGMHYTHDGKFKANNAFMSPPRELLPNYLPTHMKTELDTTDADISSAAGMLMTLSAHCKIEKDESHAMTQSSPMCDNININVSEQQHEQQQLHLHQQQQLQQQCTSTAPLFPLSSACLLVEAAVGPLERTQNSLDSEFKLPPKTKKTIMNEWLHQSDNPNVYQQHISDIPSEQLQQERIDHHEQQQQQHHHLQQQLQLQHQQEQEKQNQEQFSQQQQSTYAVSPKYCDYPQFNRQTPYQEEPQNLSMAAKRVVEFININTQDEENEMKWHAANNQNVHNESPQIEHIQTVPQPMPTPPMQCGSSVKKRWLRQAISEECSDDVSTSPPNGYMTPLKKRRMARENAELLKNNCSIPAAAAMCQMPIVTACEQLVNTVNENYSTDDVKDVKKIEIVCNVKEEDVVPFDNECKVKFEIDEREEKILSAEIKDEPIKIDSVVKQEDVLNDVKTVVSSNIDSKIPIQSEPLQQPILNDVNISFAASITTKITDTEMVQACLSENKIDDLKANQSTDNNMIAVGSSKIITNIAGTVQSFVKESNLFTDKGSQSPPIPVHFIQKPIIEPAIAALPPAEFKRVKKIPMEDEFDIKPLAEVAKDDWSSTESSPINTSPLPMDKHAVSIPTNISTNNDEIEDIQKRLHSFHNENLMILQSRNKKKLSRATTPTCDDVQSTSDSNTQSPVNEKSTDSNTLLKNTEIETTLQKNSDIIDHAPLATVSIDEKQLKQNDTVTCVKTNLWNSAEFMTSSALSVATIPTFNQSILNVPPYSAYILNNMTAATHTQQTYGIVASMPIATAVPQTVSQQTKPISPVTTTAIPMTTSLSLSLASTTTTPNHQVYSSNYNKFNSDFPEVVSHIPSTTSLLSEYLENPNKPTSYSTLGGYMSMLDTPRQHSMFNSSTITPPSINTSFLQKSYSTLDIPSAVTIGGSVLNSTVSPSIKLSRQQSADPRLNPSLTTPEPPPAPKRKLSINEYRKRKQLTDSEKKLSPNNDGNKEKCNRILADPVTPENCSIDNDLSSLSMSSKSSSKESVFSPAPTLLEMQQENLSKRLKNYKSLHGLSTSLSILNCMEKDDNEVQSILKLESISKLSGSNSSLTSISSTTSSKTTPTPTPPPTEQSTSSELETMNLNKNSSHMSDNKTNDNNYSTVTNDNDVDDLKCINEKSKTPAEDECDRKQQKKGNSNNNNNNRDDNASPSESTSR